MNWKVVAAAGTALGTAVLLVRRRKRKTAAGARSWAEATDSVTRFGT